MTTETAPYEAIDPILMRWASHCGVHVATTDRDTPVRAVSVYDRSGNLKAQIWIEPVGPDSTMTVVASPRDDRSPSWWGVREERHATLATLETTLEELRLISFGWAGPGAFA
jgi:hypothetical protein